MYYLDCDTINYLVRGNESIAKRIEDTPPDDIAISTITAEELLGPQIGEVKSRRGRGISFSRESGFLAQLIMAVGRFNVHPYTDEAEELYQEFARATRRVGPRDARLAAHVSLVAGTVVTNNVNDFDEICGKEALHTVSIENWS